MVWSWIEINGIARNFQPLINACNMLFTFLIGLSLFFVGWGANRIAKQEQASRKYRIKKDEREIFYSVYSKLSKAIGLVLVTGEVDDEARALFWQARDEARLNLPDDIRDYTQQLFDEMLKAYVIRTTKLTKASLDDPELPKGKARREAAKEHCKLIEGLMCKKPQEIFAKYMKIRPYV